MKTENQIIDKKRLSKYIAREQLASIMNNTKWCKLRELMLSMQQPPKYRLKCLRTEEESYWDSEWYYHLPEYKEIEWLEINPVLKENIGKLIDDKIIDKTQEFIELFQKSNIPFSMAGEYIRIWGYQRPGIIINFA